MKKKTRILPISTTPINAKTILIADHDYDDVIHLDICIVVAFHKGISIVSYNGLRKEQYDILDVKSHRFSF